MAEMSISKFFKMLSEEPDRLKKAVMKLEYEIASRIREEAVKNIDKKFGKGTKPYSKPMTGALRRSLRIEAEGRHLVVVAGGNNVPYAVIHEFGGIIKPVRRVWLTVPAKRKYVRRRAREFSLQFVEVHPGRLAMLIDPNAPKNDQVAYWLVKSVKIPARPYLMPAAKKVANSKTVRDMTRRLIGRATFDWSITSD